MSHRHSQFTDDSSDFFPTVYHHHGDSSSTTEQRLRSPIGEHLTTSFEVESLKPPLPPDPLSDIGTCVESEERVTPRSCSIGDDRLPSCHCASVVCDLLANQEYRVCVEYAAEYLGQQQVGRLVVTDVIRVLRAVVTSFARLAEVARARAALQLLHETMEHAIHSGALPTTSAQKKNQIHYHLLEADVHLVNGEREEAIQSFVVAWRHQAWLYGPSSLACIRTSLQIAAVKIELLQDGESQSLLQSAEKQLEECHSLQRDDLDASEVVNGLIIRASIKKMFATLECRQRRHAAARRLLVDALIVLRDAQCLVLNRRKGKGEEDLLNEIHYDVVNATVSGNTALDALRSAAMIQLAEVELVPGAVADDAVLLPHQQRTLPGGGLDSFAVALELTKKILSPLHPFVVKQRLRHAHVLAASDNPLVPGRLPSSHHQSVHSMSYFQLSMAADHLLGDLSNNKPTRGIVVAKGLVEELLEELCQSELRGGRQLACLVDAHRTLGDLLRQMGDHRAAATQYYRAKSTASMLFAPDHEECALLQHKLAESLLVCGHTDDAYHLLLELREWCKLCPAGRAPPIPLFVLNHSIGCALRVTEDYVKAEQYLKEALQDPQLDSGTHSKVLGNLAALKLQSGNIDEAIRYNREALALRIANTSSECSEEVAASYGNLAELYFRYKQNYSMALQLAEKCMNVVRRLYAADHLHPSGHHKGGAQNHSTTVVSQPSILRFTNSTVKVPSSWSTQYETHRFYVAASKIKAQCTQKLKAQYNQKISHGR